MGMYDENFYNALEREREEHQQQQVALYLARVMGWMCVGLLTTLAAALVCLAVPSVQYALYSGNLIYGILLAQLAVVVAMSAAARKVGPALATVLFMAYSALTGVTFTALAFLFETTSLVFVFGVTALLFVGMSVYGFITKKDLTRIGSLLFFALFGVIIAGVVNMFLGSGLLDFLVITVGIVIFLGLTAYDTQRIKAIYLDATASGLDEESPELRKMAIYGALTLYLDFINLFLKLLRLLGRRRS